MAIPRGSVQRRITITKAGAYSISKGAGYSVTYISQRPKVVTTRLSFNSSCYGRNDDTVRLNSKLARKDRRCMMNAHH